MMRRGDHPQAKARPTAQNGIPHRLGVQAGVAQVDFISRLTGKSGLADQHRTTRQFALHQLVILKIADGIAEQIGHQVFGQRALNLNRGHVQFRDVHLIAQPHIHALQPQQQIAVRRGKPELILVQPQKHWIVQDAALFVAQDRILAAPRLDTCRVTGDHPVHKSLGIGALDANLPLNSYVPKRDAIDQRVIFGHRAAVFGFNIPARMIHAVIDRGPPASRLDRQVPEWRFAHPGRDQHLNRCRPALT